MALTSNQVLHILRTTFGEITYTENKWGDTTEDDPVVKFLTKGEGDKKGNDIHFIDHTSVDYGNISEDGSDVTSIIALDGLLYKVIFMLSSYSGYSVQEYFHAREVNAKVKEITFYE